eukprot:1161954-Pelagomonas_calceolata.AAC.7
MGSSAFSFSSFMDAGGLHASACGAFCVLHERCTVCVCKARSLCVCKCKGGKLERMHIPVAKPPQRQESSMPQRA